MHVAQLFPSTSPGTTSTALELELEFVYFIVQSFIHLRNLFAIVIFEFP